MGAIPRNFTSVLDTRAGDLREQPAFIFLENGERESQRLSYGELKNAVDILAEQLLAQQETGQRALLVYRPGLDFIIAFLACLQAGVIAVPAPPPRHAERSGRFRDIICDAQIEWVLTTSTLGEALGSQLDPATRVLYTDQCAQAGGPSAGARQRPGMGATDIAFLQYTSGSTGQPKGVMVTHGNLLHNLGMISDAFGTRVGEVCVSWIPPHHDMGLIGSLLGTLYAGMTCVLMAPLAFVQKPVRWLRAISHYRATISGAPDFAYALCAQKIRDEQIEALDLSTWVLAFCGAEPVRSASIERFSARFAASGFRKNAFYPCYGMAEATLFVAGPGPSRGEPHLAAWDREALASGTALPAEDACAPASISLVSCGAAWGAQQLHIVAPEHGTLCAARQVGEIWLAGPNVAPGYWGNREASQKTFGANLPNASQDFLRTGDLGFMDDGHLFITGRLKDLIIIRGRNHAPHDIEESVRENVAELATNTCAAFSVQQADDSEALVLVQEIVQRQAATIDAEATIAAIRKVLVSVHGVDPVDIVLTVSARLARTSSGKLRRHECRRKYVAGEFTRLSGQLPHPPLEQ